jgi:hypothetical protein
MLLLARYPSARHAIHKARSRLSYPEAVDHPDQPRDGSDKPLRSGPKIDRPLTDPGANAADHRAGARPKKWMIGATKAAIGRQLIGKEAQISRKTTLSKR